MSLDFVAVDVETANWDRGSICSFGWAEVRDGQIINTGSRLCRPPEELDWFSGFNIAIHGITPGDVANAPRFDEVVPELLDSFGDLPVVAHNAAFDIGALREAHSYSGIPWPSLSYGCTLVWSRRLLALPSHSLPVVCDYLGFPLDNHHDAACDAIAAGNIALALSESVGAKNLEDLLNATYSRLGRLAPGQWAGCRVRQSGGEGGGGSRPKPPEANLDADPDNPFYGQHVVFTGGLGCMFRKPAFECVAEAGGIVQNGVTKKTSILVIGDGFAGGTVEDFLRVTTKTEKALEYRAKGQPIEFWSEVDFVEALMTADVVPFNTGADGSRNLALAGGRTLFSSLSPEAWEPPETYPSISSAYWRWFEAHLSGGSRAIGGEPCRICDEAIARNAPWKFRDRHVCSSECNSKLKRRFKSAVARGEIREYDSPVVDFDNPVVDLDAPVLRPRLYVVNDN
ncbi:MAG: exonuclease domain-containing protein [Mycobacterium sp.]